MAYTDPPNFPNNTTITSAELNTYLRDNLESLRDHGDLMCALRLGVDQGIANGITTSISWTTAERNQGSLWASASADRIYLRAAGRWRLWGTVGYSANTTVGSRFTMFRWDNETTNQELQGQSGDANAATAIGVFPHYHNFAPTIYTSSTGRYIRIMVNQNSGASMSVLANGATVLASRVGVRFMGEWTSAT